jgi:hypothetical protein
MPSCGAALCRIKGTAIGLPFVADQDPSKVMSSAREVCIAIKAIVIFAYRVRPRLWIAPTIVHSTPQGSAPPLWRHEREGGIKVLINMDEKL